MGKLTEIQDGFHEWHASPAVSELLGTLLSVVKLRGRPLSKTLFSAL